MTRPPPITTRTDSPCPYTPHFRSAGQANPGLICNDGNASEAVELPEEGHCPGGVSGQARQFDAVDRPRLNEHMHLFVSRHRAVQSGHDRVKIRAGDLACDCEGEHIVRTVEKLVHSDLLPAPSYENSRRSEERRVGKDGVMTCK